MSSARIPEWASSALLLVLCAGAVFLIWSLAAENQELNAEVTDLRVQLGSMQETTALQVSIAEGDAIPDTPVVGPANETATLSALVSRGGVIAVLTTTCPYCKEMLPTWAQLAEEYAERGVPFVGLMLDSPEAAALYATEETVEFPLWALAEPDVADLRVALVPYTMLVRSNGEVGAVWTGILDETEAAMLTSALDGESFAAQMLSGSLERDPECCAKTTLDTDVVSTQ